MWVQSLVRNIPWSRKWHPTPGKSQGRTKCQCQQRRVAPWEAWLDPLTSRETSVTNFCLQTGASLFMFSLSEINWMCSAREIDRGTD